MARILLSPLAHSLTGSIANITFATSKGVDYLKQHKRPYDPQTPAQLAHRTSIGLTGPMWRAMSDQLQEAFTNAPLRPEIPGYHTFVSRTRATLQAQDGIVGPGLSPGAAEPFPLPWNQHFTNMWWADNHAFSYWTPYGAGPDYRMGFFLWNDSFDEFDSEKINAAPSDGGGITIPIRRSGCFYSFMGISYRLSDQEILHCHHERAWVL